MIRKRHNLIGQTIGLGTVTKELETVKIQDGKYLREYQNWELICKCNNVYTCSNKYLINTKKPVLSCGCIKRADLKDKKFGKGTVINFLGHKMRGDTSKRQCCVWQLKCDCGNIYEAFSEHLTSGVKVSCGCHKSNFHNNFHKKTFSIYLNYMRQDAKRRGRVFNLSKEFLLELIINQSNKCKLSGLDISFENGTASLDRINNDIDYIEGNVQWVHRSVNYMKNTLNQERFIELCQLITNFNSKI